MGLRQGSSATIARLRILNHIIDFICPFLFAEKGFLMLVNAFWIW